MAKTYSNKSHISGLGKNYAKEKMERYWRMFSAIQGDPMIDSGELTEAITNINTILEKEMSALMRKGISIPNK